MLSTARTRTSHGTKTGARGDMEGAGGMIPRFNLSQHVLKSGTKLKSATRTGLR